MRETDFKRWLEKQEYRPNTINTQLQHARKIEGAYGDLDELYGKDGFESLIADLTYSASDKIANRPNPSKVQLWGNTYRDLASLRASVRYYQRFRQGVKRIREGLQSPDRNAVEQAMDECDRIGVLTFMDSYGFSWPNVEHYAMRGDTPYPSKAIFAVAHQYMPSGIALDHECCNGNEAHKRLAALGFAISKQPAIQLVGKDGRTYEPVQQENRQTGQKAFRCKPVGASNRTQDAIEIKDVVDLARVLFVEKRPVRIGPIDGGTANYLTYPGQTFSGYWLRPDIAAAIEVISRVSSQPDTHEGASVMICKPENIILYGPPGTGKTWRTAHEAVLLCDGRVPSDRSALMMRYRALEKEKRIAFVTFHQSMDYESFVEGLRPETENSDVDGAGFRLEPRPGIFRTICSIAEQARQGHGNRGKSGINLDGKQFWKMSLGAIGSEDEIYEGAINGDYIALGWGGHVDWSDVRFENAAEVEREWKSVERDDKSPSNYTQLWAFRSKMQKGDIVIVPYGNSAFRAVAEVTGDYIYVPSESGGYNHQRRVRWLLKAADPLPLDTIVDGNFTMRTLYPVPESRLNKAALGSLLSDDQTVNVSAPDQFVLVIDEINRANVSKVFGELITLIEPDKRLGEPNELEVVLPYSRKSFGVPNNLHIVGTMNTADRSIALLDTALRRRFRFIEMAPDPKVLSEAAKQTGLPLDAALAKMNDRIEYLIDRDHRIGHAFLVGCRSREAVDEAFRDKVIPLLQEYFFEDWSKVAAVLGERTEHNGSDYDGAFLGCRVLKDPTGEGEQNRLSWYVRSEFAADAYQRLVRSALYSTTIDRPLHSEDA